MTDGYQSVIADIRADESDPLAAAVFMSIGAASTCWESLDGTGVFQSDRAKAIGLDLVQYIHAQAARGQGDWAGPSVDTRAVTVDPGPIVAAWLEQQAEDPTLAQAMLGSMDQGPEVGLMAELIRRARA